MSGFDLTGALRRIRRRADLSQRELAAAVGVSHAVIAQAEAGRRGMAIDLFARLASLARLRLALLDEEGREVTGMTNDGVRDRGYRRMPAHLDPTLSVDIEQWVFRRARAHPTYTFLRDRDARDAERQQLGTPDDHRVPQPGDSPEEREAARREAAWRRQREKHLAWLAAHPGEGGGPDFRCECPAECDELDDRSGKPVHAADCPCGCDVA